MRPYQLLVTVAAGCYSPTAPTGAPCVDDSDCPSTQVCQPSTHSCEAPCVGCDVDAAPVECWSAWLDGTVNLGVPTRVAELNVQGTGSLNPSISFDGLEIYLARGGTVTGVDLLRATRTSRDAPFGTPQLVTELQTALDESRISLTAEGLVGVFTSSRTGTVGGLDLWQTKRASLTSEWREITATPFASINNASSQFDPEITPDGLDLYYAPPENGRQSIVHASRRAVADAFGLPTVVAIAGGGLTNFYDPAIAPDQRVLVFTGEVGMASDDLYYVTRASVDAAFGPAVLVPVVNSSTHDGDVDISADGCTLYFVSDRGGLDEIYAADVIR